MTVLGTRPEIIRLSRIIPKLDAHSDHILVHTGQNYTASLSQVFFDELGVRAPDETLEVRAGSFGEQAGQILSRIEPLFNSYRPERLLLLGDTNSGLVSIVAKRLGIPVFHMEAGNRCFDDRVPEEVNRRIIDHSSSVLMPYTERARANLLAEGIASKRIFVTGNPIKEVMNHYREHVERSTALHDLGLGSGQFVLVTAHRAENVDKPDRLKDLLRGLDVIQRKLEVPVVISFHPRTRSKIDEHGLDSDNPELRFLEPFGFFDFIHLEQKALCVITDSGTVQEETCILGVPNVTIRDVTERPETLESGSNTLAGVEPEALLSSVEMVLASDRSRWRIPPEYLVENASDTVLRLIVGRYDADRSELEWLDG